MMSITVTRTDWAVRVLSEHVSFLEEQLAERKASMEAHRQYLAVGEDWVEETTNQIAQCRAAMLRLGDPT